MNTLSRLIDWLKTNPGIGPGQADYWRGIWKDNATNKSKRLVSVMAVGGPAGGVLLDQVNYRVLLLGPQDPPAGESEALHDVLTALCKRLKIDYSACEIAQIRVIGGIIGPGLTTENRPWYEINLQLLI